MLITAEVKTLLDTWPRVRPTLRKLCGCGRAYIVGEQHGKPCEECLEEIYREEAAQQHLDSRRETYEDDREAREYGCSGHPQEAFYD